MFGEEVYECVKKLYVSLVLEVVQRHLKSIAFINSDPKIFYGKGINKCSHETEVIPLPVLYFDEQKNGDVIKIVHWYQQLIEDVHQKAGVSLGSVHIGGDQLFLLCFFLIITNFQYMYNCCNVLILV